MPSLLQSLKKPHPWLATFLLAVTLSLLDGCRHPSEQATARIYIRCVNLYQHYGRPMIDNWIQCHYRPSCSAYSITAVRRHGIRAGLFLTVKRVKSCTPDVPMGTYDPVP